MCGVAGGEPPALIERRTRRRTGAGHPKGVAGGEPPALIERARGITIVKAVKEVSPGVNPRPSLNGPYGVRYWCVPDSVAGGEPPALIERTSSRTRRSF